MINKIIDGKKHAASLTATLEKRVKSLKQSHNITPGLAVIIAGDDPASQVYVRNKKKRADEIGIKASIYNFPNNVTENELSSLITKLNADNKTHGIIIQLPLPAHLDSNKILNIVDYNKDVDGFCYQNIGRLHSGRPNFIPCTPLGCINLLKEYEPNLTGKNVVIVGRSNIVGKPLSALLLQENCTVTICHSHTQNLANITSKADILCTAIGSPSFFDASYVKEGAIIIDVGINRITKEGKTKLQGDINFNDVINKVKYITPVPGGVGPMTIGYLLHNTLIAAQRTIDTYANPRV